jgi:hypothetical protein
MKTGEIKTAKEYTEAASGDKVAVKSTYREAVTSQSQR